jgi:hypothetical protein
VRLLQRRRVRDDHGLFGELLAQCHGGDGRGVGGLVEVERHDPGGRTGLAVGAVEVGAEVDVQRDGTADDHERGDQSDDGEP